MLERDLAIGRVYKCYDGKYYIVTGLENGLVLYQDTETKVGWETPLEDFINSKVPEGSSSTQEYQFERADIIHRNTGKGADMITEAIQKNDGYCPCKINKSNDTLCMCREFRETMGDAVCHCGLYTKIWLGDQM